MEEVWKQVCGVNYLEVSNLGNVRTLNRYINHHGGKGIALCKGKDKSKVISSSGYLHVMYEENGIAHDFLIHRLVANAFIPNPLNKRTVNHINGNKLDNRVENLEWATYSENRLHAISTGLVKPTRPYYCGENNPLSIPIIVYCNGKIIGEYESISLASKALNLPYPSVKWALKEKRLYKGFMFVRS